MNKHGTARQLTDDLLHFYRDPDHVLDMLKVLKERRKDKHVSLRLLDYFVVNYAAEYSVAYPHPGNADTLFEVAKSYEAFMKTYHKALFDPFRRGADEERLDFEFTLPDGTVDVVDTTLAQLNFFRWIIYNGILQYVEENRDLITQSMRDHARRNRGYSDDDTSTQSSMMEYSLGMASRRRRSRRSAKISVPARRTPMHGKRSYVVTF